MANFVLIPGAFHGAWCFDRVEKLLRVEGHHTISVDPALWKPFAPDGAAPSQRSWVDEVTEAVDAMDGPVVLVGHSRGGILVSLACEQRPDRIAAGVYLSGALLPSGSVPIEGMMALAGGPAAELAISALPEALPVPPLEAALSALYNCCSEADARAAWERLLPEPVAPLAEPMMLSDTNFGRVPRAYVECLRDKAVPLALQRGMQDQLPCSIVRSLDADHSPFLSAAQPLANTLTSIAMEAGAS